MKRMVFIFAFLLPLALAAAPAALANSAGPYSLTVILENPPDGLKVSILLADGTDTGILYGRVKGWETSYKHYFFSQNELDGAALLVRSDEKSFTCPIPSLAKFNSVMLLDLQNERFSEGKMAFRAVKLVSMRVALTLLIEGLVFFLFLYKTRRSWIIFIVVNLITQSVFNAVLIGSGAAAFYAAYALLLFPFEFLIILAEASAFIILLKEHSRRRAVAFAAVANIVSWLLGILILGNLPI